MKHFGEALVTVRRARDLTQEELAELVGISQGALSRYESDLREPEPEVLEKLSAALGVTPRFFERAERMRGAIAIDAHMRRRATAKATDWRRQEAKLNVYRLHVQQLFEEVSLRSTLRVPSFDTVDTLPSAAARMVRMQWRMPVGPIRNLAAWMEAAGIVIIEEDFGTARIDGLSHWAGDHPVVLLNMRPPTDRKRLTLAHELAHLCLHTDYISEDAEQEANAFAAELLMPGDVIRSQLRNLMIGKLIDLKREWHVSMQALIERAHDLGVITAVQRMNLYKTISAKGWRIHEPAGDELPQEKAQLPQRIGDALQERGLNLKQIADIAGFAGNVTDHPFRPSSKPPGQRHLTAVPRR